MAANTSILIKRSTGSSKPTRLASGELAYSYSSNTIFIGTSDGLATLNIGGYLYTNDIDTATSSATASKLVRRDSTGNAAFNFVTANVVGNLYGNATSATQLQTARNFSIDGSDVDSSTVSFDGTGNVILQGNLKSTGVAAGTYGGTSNVPVFTVDSKGRLSYAANVSVSTTLNINADIGGPSTVDLLTQTLNVAGGSGLTSNVSGQTITLDVDNTVIRANTAMSYQEIDGDLRISGNLVVQGNTTTIDVATLNVADPLIYLAADNYSSDVLDIGFVGNYFDGAQRHAGVFRHAGDKQFYIFDNYNIEPTANTIDPTDSSFRLATTHTNLTANTANVVQTLSMSSGSWLYANGDVYFANGFINNANTTINANKYLILKNTDNSSQALIGNKGSSGSNEVTISADTTVSGNIKATSYTFGSGAERISTDGSSIVLSPDNGADALAGVKIIGNGYILGPNGARNMALNYGGTSGTVGAYNLNVYSGTDSSAYNNGALIVQGGIGASGNVYFNKNLNVANTATVQKLSSTGQVIANTSTGTSGGGFSFQGDATTGVFSPSAGNVGLYANDTEVAYFNQSYLTVAKPTYMSGLNSATTSYLLYWNNSTGEVTTGSMGDLRPTAIANGAYSFGISSVDGSLTSSSGQLLINSVRYTATQDATYDGIMFYNSNTKEARYSYVLDGGSF